MAQHHGSSLHAAPVWQGGASEAGAECCQLTGVTFLNKEISCCICPLDSEAPSPRALILAAGVGRRLTAGHQDGGHQDGGHQDGEHPAKVLLRFEGLSLLARHLAILRSCGVRDITLVLGYDEDRVRAELDALDGPLPLVVTNPDFRAGSIVSLHAGRDVLRSGTPILLMDADVLYDARLMLRLLRSGAASCLLLDRDIEPGDEPVKLCVSGGRIVDFHKRPRVAHEWHGESVGFFRFAPDAAAELAHRAKTYVEFRIPSAGVRGADQGHDSRQRTGAFWF